MGGCASRPPSENVKKPPHDDPRESECFVSFTTRHKWSKGYKDKVNRGQYVQLLRCKYCAKYVCVEFKREILPSGRVMVTERAFETVEPTPEVTPQLHQEPTEPTDAELAECEAFVTNHLRGRLL